MASRIEKLLPLQMTNADKSVVFTVHVHPDVQEKCVQDTQLSTKMFLRMEQKFQVDSSGHRNLNRKKSYAVDTQKKSSRKPNWATEQTLFLPRLVGEDHAVLLGKFGPGITTARKTETWNNITKPINATFTGIPESYELASEFGLLKPVFSASKDSGVRISMNITKPTEFDGVSTAAYAKEDMSDETLCRLGRIIPKNLTAQERVRFLEHLVASVPDDDHSQVSAVPKASTSSTCDSGRNKYDTLGDDMEVDTQDDTDSVFSIATSSSFTSQSQQSQGRINWNEPQVRLLITLRRQYEHLFSSSVVTQKQAWKKVSEEMAEKGYCYSADDCQRKFGSLRLRYQTIKDRHNKTGRGRSTWKFYSLLEEMYAGDPAVEPLCEVSSLQHRIRVTCAPTSPERESTDTFMADDYIKTPNSKKTTPKTPVSRKTSTTLAASLAELSEMREQQKRHHEERMEVEKRRLEIEEKRLQTLQKLVDAIVESKK